MAKQIEGVYERLLQCGKEEFLKKGYNDASLRTIAAKAGTSTNSIYVRFRDKEGLFEAIVQPVVDGVMELFCSIQETFHGFDAETQRERMNEYSFGGMERMLDYMYENFDAFRLLLDASYGTRFQNFVDELARLEVEYTYKYLEAVGFSGIEKGEVTEEFLHIVNTAYFEGVFEVIRHQMDRKTAGRYIRMLERYHAAGFGTLLDPDGK